eukprot:2078019-Amphidinium_carterae.3
MDSQVGTLAEEGDEPPSAVLCLQLVYCEAAFSWCVCTAQPGFLHCQDVQLEVLHLIDDIGNLSGHVAVRSVKVRSDCDSIPSLLDVCVCGCSADGGGAAALVASVFCVMTVS